MSERTREQDLDAEKAAAQAEAERAEQEAREKAKAEEEAREEEETDEEKAEKRGPRGPWLTRSPVSRLALALSVAGVPLAEHLAEHVVEFDWHKDGRFELILSTGLSFATPEGELVLEDQVTGVADHSGLSLLEGVSHAGPEVGGQVERITGEDVGTQLELHLTDNPEPVRMKAPAHDAPPKPVI